MKRDQITQTVHNYKSNCIKNLTLLILLDHPIFENIKRIEEFCKVLKIDFVMKNFKIVKGILKSMQNLLLNFGVILENGI